MKAATVKNTKIKYRKHQWFDERTNAIGFGIQAKFVGKRGPWMHCTTGPRILIFASESLCDAYIKRLCAQKGGAA